MKLLREMDNFRILTRVLSDGDIAYSVEERAPGSLDGESYWKSLFEICLNKYQAMETAGRDRFIAYLLKRYTDINIDPNS